MSHFSPLATYFTTILCKKFCTWPSFFFFLSRFYAEWAPVPITAACWLSGTVSTPSFLSVSTQEPVALCPSLLILLNKRNQHPKKATQQPIERYNRNCSNCVIKWSRILQIESALQRQHFNVEIWVVRLSLARNSVLEWSRIFWAFWMEWTTFNNLIKKKSLS